MEVTILGEAERRFSEQYPRLYAALMALGETNTERAEKLGVSRRTFLNIRTGAYSLKTPMLEAHPHLAQAWCEDVQSRPRRAA